MGKNQHSKDKLYIIPTEYARDWGGFKAKSMDKPLKALPFDFCALSIKPFTTPVCSLDGFVFEKTCILPWLKQNKRNPVNGESLAKEDLFPLTFHRNEAGSYHCPVTGKAFNAFSHIVTNRRSGQVYEMDGIEIMCRKPKHWFDPITSEEFALKDVIEIQNPKNVARRCTHTFLHVLKDEATDAKPVISQPQSSLIQKTPLMAKVIIKAAKLTEERMQQKPKKKEQTATANRKLHAVHTTGRDAQSLTSTVAKPGGGVVEYRSLTEEEVTTLIYQEIRTKKLKAYVQFTTTLGPINLELHCDKVPKTCDNFIRHCVSGYYKGTIFFRIIAGFIIQGGDPKGTGFGGESAFGKAIQDEFHPHLLHNECGVLSMANSGFKHDNKSQFFITFAPAPHLDGKHTVFGRVVGGLDTLKQMEVLKTTLKNNRPLEPPRITEVVIYKNPYKSAADSLLQQNMI